nr:transmembrane efflux protein [Rhodococcus sp. JVH1]
MTEEPTTGGSERAAGPPRALTILLAMAMLVLVVDTSLMNVSISSVVRDLDTTVSGVQAAIALEALVIGPSGSGMSTRSISARYCK